MCNWAMKTRHDRNLEWEYIVTPCPVLDGLLVCLWQGLSLELLNWLAWLALSPPRFSWLCLPISGLQACANTSRCLCSCWRPEFPSVYLHSKHLPLPSHRVRFLNDKASALQIRTLRYQTDTLNTAQSWSGWVWERDKGASLSLSGSQPRCYL